MLKADIDIYDVIIIGAGIGGLVCGCYLAKAGMKVLIAEQHHKPGGYCTSFKRGMYTFDAAAHSFGGYREKGIMKKVFKELEIDNRIKIERYNPSDIIITPHYKICFWAELDKTIENFQSVFPEEKNNINKFFHFITNPDPKTFVQIRNLTFKDLLDKFFSNKKLQAVLSFPLLGNGGLPPSLISAFSGIKIYSEFLLDGGYYPDGGMKMLPEILSQRFKQLNGTLLLNCLVKKIKLKENRVLGVILEKNEFIPARYIISNCDSRQTFFKLLGEKIIGQDFSTKLNNMLPSLSMFILYLVVDELLKTVPQPGINIWFLPHYDIEDMYFAATNRKAGNLSEYMLRVSPNTKTILCFVNASFKNKAYWEKNKDNMTETLIKKIEKYTIPNLTKHIIHKEAATPYTLYRYTLNYKGAAYGWAGIPSQLAHHDLRKPPFIEGLYLTGHWTTLAQGIPGVTYLARDTAELILRKENN